MPEALPALHASADLPDDFSPQRWPEARLSCAQVKARDAAFRQWQAQCFARFDHAEILIEQRTRFIDALLHRLWQQCGLADCPALCLLATGGYGRRELHPLSDIDLLIVSDAPPDADQQARISDFLTFLWDLHWQVGHSVRTLHDCLQTDDLTVATTLIEARRVSGDPHLYQTLQQHLFSDTFWPSAHFFAAKVAEQQQRHQRYHGTSYRLEPDLKNSPGGLRDLHILYWIARRHFAVSTFEEMIAVGFLTAEECQTLRACQRLLWRLRFALHLEVRRYDNRLLFEHQLNVAQRLRYGGEGNTPVETMMKAFYQASHQVAELNALLLALFQQTILRPNATPVAVPLDAAFERQGDQLALRDSASFTREPALIMRLFRLLATEPDLRGIAAPTLRQLHAALHRLRAPLCHSPAARADFLTIMRTPGAMQRAILPMHRHRVLGAYLPAWRRIEGQMQFDLFHVYTVDEHTVRVLLNLERFGDPQTAAAYPLCAELWSRLPRRELLLLAALFHDIGKGRHGDHAELGAEEAERFARLHRLSARDSRLISWLVRHHLLMSMTAQRRDIHDLTVVRTFSAQVESQLRLRYLFCLTVADIRATNETLWNSWKQSLLHELWFAADKQLRLGSPAVPALRARLRAHQVQALHCLALSEEEQRRLMPIWRRLGARYFLRHTPAQIAWQARHLLRYPLTTPRVFINPQPEHGGTEILLWSPDRPHLFAAVAGALDRHNLHIWDAQIFTSRDKLAIDTFIVTAPDGQPLAENRHAELCQTLTAAITQPHYRPGKARALSGRLRSFQIEPQIRFLHTHSARRTCLELVALDQPGMLARIGELFARLQLFLYSARITTIGERVEDRFILADRHQRALSTALQTILRQELTATLASTDKQ